jgi:3-methyladenine DNA glycosylase AlkC
MMETREPKKGQGVPKETPAQNNIAALQSSLAQHFPQLSWDGLRAELEARDFFAAGMQQQVRLMAEVSIDLLGPEGEKAALITALSASPVEKIRGVAAFAVPILYADDLGQQLQGLYATGALEGTWPRELSATTLHNLIINHGVAVILPRVRPWLEDPEPAIRRLVVEAFRPRGVMLAHITELKQDPSPLRGVLEPLLDDEADYVRKAVANNINDVSRDNPDRVIDWAKEWMTPDASKARQWIIARGLRTLVNEGHPTALSILGYTPPTNLQVTWRENTPQRVEINQLLPFEFEIVNPSDTEALINLLLWMDEPGKGQARRKSRYQLWKGRIAAGGSKHVSKRIQFVDKRSQPRVPGVYRLIVTINGEELEERALTFQR